MATPNDIRVQAQTLSGTPIDKATALLWLQEQIKTLAYQHFLSGKKVKEKANIEDANVPHTLERKVVQIDRVLDAERSRIEDYEYQGKTVQFARPGAYTIVYYAMPDIPETDTTAIDMPDPYVQALKYYLAARIRARYMGQNDTNAVSFFEEYSKAINAADVIMKRISGRRRVMPPGRR